MRCLAVAFAAVVAVTMPAACGDDDTFAGDNAMAFASLAEADEAAGAALYDLAGAIGASRADVDAALAEPDAAGPMAEAIPCEEPGTFQAVQRVHLPAPRDPHETAARAANVLEERYGGGTRDEMTSEDGEPEVYLSAHGNGILVRIGIRPGDVLVSVRTDCAPEVPAG